jgi:predicted dehydrogenase
MTRASHIFAAVVGTGFIGPVHVEALRRLGRPMVGVLGSTPQRSREAAERLNITRAYESFDELVADPMIQVVHLTSPNRLHYEQCKALLAAGKHIICEKPLATTAAEAAELAELARRTETATAVNYNVRYYPLCIEARERIREGRLGRLYHVTGSYTQDWLLYDTDFNWRVLATEGGALRAVADIGTHWLDLATWVTGLEIESVCADLRTFLPTRKRPAIGSVETFQTDRSAADGEVVPIATEDYGSVLLRFKGGASGSFTVSQVNAGRKNCLRFETAGSRSALAWNSEHPNELWVGHRDRANEMLLRDPALLHEAVRPFVNYPGGHNEGFPDTFKQLFRSFYEYLEAGDLTAPRPFPTFDDGSREAALCEAILRSSREGRWVSIEASKKEVHEPRPSGSGGTAV